MPNAQANSPNVEWHFNHAVAVAKFGARAKILTNLAPIFHAAKPAWFGQLRANF